MAVKRKVFNGTARELADKLAPHVVKADFLDYPENRKAPTDIKMLIKVAPLGRTLSSMNDNFSFQNKKMK